MIGRTTQGTLLRALRLLLPMDGFLPGGRSLPPDAVILVPTLRCNLHCPYCFQRTDQEIAWHPEQANELTLPEWQAVITDLRPFGPHVIVLGGELFLYRRAVDLLRSVKDAGLPLTVITNGTALPGLASSLLAIGLDRLIVSIDGPPQLHNAVRGHPRGYELAIEGIKRILAGRGSRSTPFVQVSCALTSQTQHQLETFVNLIGPVGVDLILFNGLIYATAEQIEAQREVLEQTFGVSHCEAEALDTAEQYSIDVQILCQQIKAIRAGPWRDRITFAPPGMVEHLETFHAPDAPLFANQQCTAIYRELWILPNGDIGACVHINEIKMGNVREDGILPAWNSIAFRHFRQQLASGLLPACARCEKLTYHHLSPKIHPADQASDRLKSP